MGFFFGSLFALREIFIYNSELSGKNKLIIQSLFNIKFIYLACYDIV